MKNMLPDTRLKNTNRLACSGQVPRIVGQAAALMQGVQYSLDFVALPRFGGEMKCDMLNRLATTSRSTCCIFSDV